MCGSDEVILWMGGATGSMYQCPECHYVGPLVVENDLWKTLETELGLSRGEIQYQTAWNLTGVLASELWERW